MTREQWLEERMNGIGASEAAAVMGVSPYMSNRQLWEIKSRITNPEDISEKPYVKYGTEAEKPLRELFALDYPQYKVGYCEHEIIRNKDYPFVFATLDGTLEDETGNMGILEIKTTEIMRSSQWRQWDGRIPQNYYIQVLHQLLATGYEFAILKAQIKFKKGGEMSLSTRHYHIDRQDVKGDIKELLGEEIKFWDCVTSKIRPDTKLPNI